MITKGQQINRESMSATFYASSDPIGMSGSRDKGNRTELVLHENKNNAMAWVSRSETERDRNFIPLQPVIWMKQT
jgi:hypothetical protein